VTLRENRFVVGILFPFMYEIGLIEAYLFFMANRVELFLFLPALFLIFPSYMFYVYSPYIILKVTKAAEKYHKELSEDLDKIFYLDTINLEAKIKDDLRQNIRSILLPQLKNVYRRGYIDPYFARNDTIANERLCSFRETLFLFSISFGLINLLNTATIAYLHFSSIDLDFLYIDQIVNLQNVLFFGSLFLSFVLVSGFLFFHSQRIVTSLINQLSYNLVVTAHSETFKDQSRHIELESLRKFPLEDRLGRKLAGNWDLVSKLYFEFIESPLNEEIREFSQREVAKTLVLKQYSQMLSEMDLSPEKRKELELQFYLGQEITGVIEELVSTEEETESIKIDILYTRKKLEAWEESTNDGQISTFLFLWRSVESLFRHALWKHDAYPKDDQSWLSIVNALLRERLLTVQENKSLKFIRQHRNGLLHRSQDRYINKEDVETLLKILERVLDRV
jgi:ABC-type multidrug transport system fused ATPase/permease subunit